MFILGTATVVAYVPTNDIDLVGPMPQVLRVGLGPFGIAGPLVTIAILMTLAMRVAQVSVSFTAVTRLPMVAGWDRLLPAAFSKLHPTLPDAGQLDRAGRGMRLRHVAAEPDRRRARPRRSSCCSTRGGIFYALAYVVMFAIPIFGLRGVTPRPSPLAAGRVVVGAADDGAVHRAVGVPDHPGGRAWRASRSRSWR